MIKTCTFTTEICQPSPLCVWGSVSFDFHKIKDFDFLVPNLYVGKHERKGIRFCFVFL